METNNNYGELAKAIMASCIGRTDNVPDMIIEDEPSDINTNPRLCITVCDKDGNTVQRSYGPSQAELQRAHDLHECGSWCEICYQEACNTLNDTIDKGWHND